MKQFAFLAVVTLLGALGSLVHPFWGVLLYYGFAVLRPQHLWQWALPMEVRWSLIAAAAAGLGVLLNLHRVNVRQGFNLNNQLFTCFGFFLLLSVLNAHFPAIAQEWGVEYTKILLMAAMLALVIEKVWQVNLMVMVVTLAVGYIAWEVNALYLFDGRLDIYHNGYGGLDNNGAGLMIAMGVPLAYGFVAGSNRLWLKGAAAFAAVLMIHAVMMTYSRGAMLALVVTAIWILVHHRPRMQAVGLAVVLLVVVSVLAGPQIRHRFFSTTSYHQDDSAQSRLASWKAAWEMTMDAPLTGQGLRNANKFTYTYGADRYGRTIHSQYLQIAADSGLPALAAYLAVLTLAFFNATRVRRLSLQHLRRGGDDPPTGDAPHPLFNTSVRQIAAMALGLQSSLLTFAFGGLFLSLEVFELPWLLIALAGIWPMLLERHLASLPSAALPEPEPAPQGRRGASPKRWSARRRASLPLTKKVVHP